MGLYEGFREAYPDWTDKAIVKEINRIEAEEDDPRPFRYIVRLSGGDIGLCVHARDRSDAEEQSHETLVEASRVLKGMMPEAWVEFEDFHVEEVCLD